MGSEVPLEPRVSVAADEHVATHHTSRTGLHLGGFGRVGDWSWEMGECG